MVSWGTLGTLRTLRTGFRPLRSELGLQLRVFVESSGVPGQFSEEGTYITKKGGVSTCRVPLCHPVGRG